VDMIEPHFGGHHVPTSTESKVPATRGVLFFGLGGLFAIAMAAAITFAVLYVTGRKAGRSDTGDADSAPFTQRGTVAPEGLGSGVVFYPIPYGSPPHLVLDPKSRYLIARQDEYGFTWMDRARAKDLGSLIASIPDMNGVALRAEADKFDPKQPAIAWEAKGVRGSDDMQAMRPFEQNGTFQTDIGQQGQVNFPIPYASPPNVELSGQHTRTVITECTATGFKWKNSATQGGPSWESGAVTWKSKGIRATQVPKG
jgi:hypothetical protein